ncbi:Nif3-like dinuclear metal center hexameric protein [Candidatus Parcubacteria bacterium]|nr:Nif3-like dinuclear metal center hexameric protein [Candidatus Parcubacteria bacterium]
MGLVLNNTQDVKKVYTAVFPTDDVLNKILNSGETNILLFTHHPMIWDITKIPSFININPDLLPKLKEKRISLYTLHVPLDKNGEYSTTTNLARALGIILKSEFCEYFGVNVGIIGKTNFQTVEELANKVKQAVGHKVKLYKYGAKKIRNGKVALIAGGGNDPETIPQIAKFGINVFVTGITKLSRNYPPSMKAHALLKRFKINLIGATHYSTEKFACIAMTNYFRNLGLACEFIEGKPDFQDM